LLISFGATLGVALAFQCRLACSQGLPLAERFAHPPSPARILKIIHSWPDEPASQDQLLRSLTNQGFGGAVCNVSFTEYLESAARWQAFQRAASEARNAGLALWLYDEEGYPSGTAGGLVLKNHPEWEARGLLVADTDSAGGEVSLTAPPGRLLWAAAFPLRDGRISLTERRELSAKVKEGVLRWEAPAGQWQVLAMTDHRLYEGTHAELNLFRKQPYPNLLQPEPTARFLELTHQRYAQHLGNDLGKWFVATFTDEPSLMSLFLRPMPYRCLPWADNLSRQFKQRRGYALEPLLPALVAEAGPEGQRARYDYWQTVGELVADNFFGQIQQWCAQHQAPSGGHLLMEEGIVAHVPLYGDFFRCLRKLDAPGIDCLTSLPAEVPWFIARLAASAAELEGKSIVMCETSDHVQRYRPPGDQRPVRNVTEAEIRGTCNRLMVGGVNAITSYYSFAGLSAAELRCLNDWVGRCCTMLQGGRQVADLALLYPAHCIWPKFVPARHGGGDSPAAAHIEALFRRAAEDLFAAQRDFTFVGARDLAEAKVIEGVLVWRDLRWRVVVLPGTDTLPLRAWENLALFVGQGGVVIALGARPLNSEREFPSRRVQALATTMFGEAPPTHSADKNARPIVSANVAGGGGIFLPPGRETLLAAVLDRVLEADVQPSAPRSPLRVTHRRVEGREVYFLINDSPAAWQGQVSLCAVGQGEQWNPATGTATVIGQPKNIPISLDAYGATLLTFPKGRLPGRHRIQDARWVGPLRSKDAGVQFGLILP
jgi:hypothetical protein